MTDELTDDLREHEDFLEEGSHSRLKKMHSRFKERDEINSSDNSLLARVRGITHQSNQKQWIRCRLHWFGELDQPADDQSEADNARCNAIDVSEGNGAFPNSERSLEQYEDYRLSRNRNTVWNLPRLTDSALNDSTAGLPSSHGNLTNESADAHSLEAETQPPLEAPSLDRQNNEQPKSSRVSICAAVSIPARAQKEIPALAHASAGIHIAHSKSPISASQAHVSQLYAAKPSESRINQGLSRRPVEQKNAVPQTHGSAEVGGENALVSPTDTPPQPVAPCYLPTSCGGEAGYEHVALLAALKSARVSPRLHELPSFIPMYELNATWVHLIEHLLFQTDNNREVSRNTERLSFDPQPQLSTAEKIDLCISVGELEASNEPLIDFTPETEILLPVLYESDAFYEHSRLLSSLSSRKDSRAVRLHELTAFSPICEPDAAWIHLLSEPVNGN